MAAVKTNHSLLVSVCFIFPRWCLLLHLFVCVCVCACVHSRCFNISCRGTVLLYLQTRVLKIHFLRLLSTVCCSICNAKKMCVCCECTAASQKQTTRSPTRAHTHTHTHNVIPLAHSCLCVCRVVCLPERVCLPRCLRACVRVRVCVCVCVSKCVWYLMSAVTSQSVWAHNKRQ